MVSVPNRLFRLNCFCADYESSVEGADTQAPHRVTLGVEQKTIQKVARRPEAILFAGGFCLSPRVYGGASDPTSSQLLKFYDESHTENIPRLRRGGFGEGLKISEVAAAMADLNLAGLL